MQKRAFAVMPLLVLLLLFEYGDAFSQPLPKPQCELHVEFIGDSVHYNHLDTSSNYAGDSIAVTCLVVVPQGMVPSKIHVKAGTVAGGNGLLEKSFVYDGPTDQGEGTSYRRDGRYVYLGLGLYYGVAFIHAEIWLEDASGRLSPVRQVYAGHP